MNDNVEPETGAHRWEKVYFGELDEVYLLLDFIAGRPDRNVSSLEIELSEEVDNNAVPGKKILQKVTLGAPEIVKRISKLRFPEGSAVQRSEDAAFVLIAKDRLSAFAYPATAQSIAFTYFVTETMATASRIGGLRQVEHVQAHAVDGTRGSVVRRVYPELKAMADAFCRARWWTILFTLVLAIIGALLLAETTYGGQLAARLQAAKRDASAAADAVYTAYDTQNPIAGQSGRPRPAGVRAICLASAEQGGSPVSQATPAGAEPAATKPPSQGGDTTSRFARLCGEYAYSQASFDNAISDMDAYARSWPVHLFRWVTPIHDIGDKKCLAFRPGETNTAEQKPEEKTCGPRQEMGPSVSVMVSGFANLILPLIFGVIGALSATIRRVQTKIADSILVPRDRSLLLFQVMLGVVAGGSVALFVDPAKVAAEITSGHPTLSVSAAGIAFLAGYGAPAFFLMLDKLLARIFDFRDEQQPVSGPAQGKSN